MNSIVKKRATRGSSAFTLIELLVVISIIGMLSSITLASLAQAKQRALISAHQSNLKTIEKLLVIYKSSYGYYPIVNKNHLNSDERDGIIGMSQLSTIFINEGYISQPFPVSTLEYYVANCNDPSMQGLCSSYGSDTNDIYVGIDRCGSPPPVGSAIYFRTPDNVPYPGYTQFTYENYKCLY